MRAILFAVVAAALPVQGLAQQAPAEAVPATATPAAVDPALAREVVNTLAQQLEADFVFPETGKAYATMLRANLAAGRYDEFTAPSAFAKAVTEDLQRVHRDGHLRVHVVPPEARGGPAADGPGQQGPDPALNTITGAGWVAQGIAYIAFDAFFGTPATMAALERFISDHAGAHTLIIDVRFHRGGDLAEMDLLLPHIFAEPTVLVTMDTRASVAERGGSGPEAGRLRRVAGPEGVVREEHFVEPQPGGAFQQARVYLLTSKRTASAAEHLALALKRRGRAVLIGETTYGAGNFGGMVPLDESFSFAAFIPNGRSFNPDTGIGWEGSGIEPDIAVPADQALAEALRRAGADPNLPAPVALAAMR